MKMEKKCVIFCVLFFINSIYCSNFKPFLRLWSNDSATVNLGRQKYYFCKIEGAPHIVPHFYQSKDSKASLLKATSKSESTAVLLKTFESSDDGSELYCQWTTTEVPSRKISLGFEELDNGQPFIRIWSNGSALDQKGYQKYYFCTIYNVDGFFLSTPVFFQSKGSKLCIQNATSTDRGTAILMKTLDVSDDESELYCQWKPVKSKGDIFPTEVVSRKIAIRFGHFENDVCDCETLWAWVAGIAVGALVATLVAMTLLCCHRCKTRRQMADPQARHSQACSHHPSEHPQDYTYVGVPVVSWEEAHGRASDNRPLPRYVPMAPHLPPRNDGEVYEYIRPDVLRKK